MRNDLRKFLGVASHGGKVDFQIVESAKEESFERHLINYSGSESDTIPAYLFVPKGDGLCPGILIHHQHNGERHLGKSEVAGLAGDQFQAFGPKLAENGFVVLAPDSICFEDRRSNQKGILPGSGEEDWLQHFNEMAYRLVKGTTLMKKVLDDALIGFSLLINHPSVSKDRVGLLGHSYGGNTTFFQAAVDNRVQFACSSGAVCSYQQKMAVGTGLEFALIVPGVTKHYDFGDILQMNSEAQQLITYAKDDKYSEDAAETVMRAGTPKNVTLKEFEGGHALNQERFNFILDWVRGQT